MMLNSFCIKTFNTGHNYLFFTTLKQSKFERVVWCPKIVCILFRKWVQMMSKDSAYFVYKITTYVNCFTVCICRLNKNLNLYFVTKIWKTVRKSVNTISWNTYQVEFATEFWTEVFFVLRYTIPENRQKIIKRHILHNY